MGKTKHRWEFYLADYKTVFFNIEIAINYIKRSKNVEKNTEKLKEPMKTIEQRCDEQRELDKRYISFDELSKHCPMAIRELDRIVEDYNRITKDESLDLTKLIRLTSSASDIIDKYYFTHNQLQLNF